ncbi:MAG: hypothetical protein EOP83_22480, partial [Verrucomicrobiaceae bacterium]
MLVVAGTLTFVATSGDESAVAQTPGTNRGKGTTAQFREVSSSGAWQQESTVRGLRSDIPDNPAFARRSRAELAGFTAKGQAELRTDLKVQVNPRHLRHKELQANASRVESFALRHLAQLTDDLELTPEQQGRIFPILVRGAKSYEPGMQVVDGRSGNGSTSPVSESTTDVKPLDPQEQQELLQQELDMPQAEALVQLSERDLMIWEELINDLTKQLDLATPGQVAEVTPTPSTPAVDPEPEREVPGGSGNFQRLG